MLWNLTGSGSALIDDSNEPEAAEWWPSKCDGFGLPFVAALFGYQPDRDREWERLSSASSPPIGG